MLVAHVVSHTHWDREWYHSAGRFRQRLVALIDELIEDPPAAGDSFLLDGQAIVLEDYLAVRPDRCVPLAELLRNGRLEAGPWYVLADELLPSGEALVRNLLAGRRALRELSAAPPPVLYCPDSFGHPAILPELANGFGLELIILWRGYGGRRWPAGDTVRWISPGGVSTIVFHLPSDGYEYGADLPTSAAAARDRWTRMRQELGARTTAGVLLVPNGADHHARQRGLRDAIRSLAEAAAPDELRASSLHMFADALVQQASGMTLPTISGELRDSYGYAWTLQGTFGTRAHQKRANASLQRLLERDAEPWSALAHRLRGRSRHALTAAAWKTLLRAHPHDTLCGCSVDEVAEAMEARLADARSQGKGIREDALADVIGHDAIAARAQRDQWRPRVVVRNRAPRARGGVAIVDVVDFLADAPVGPSSAGKSTTQSSRRATASIQGAVATQVLEHHTAFDRIESPLHYPDNDLVAISRVAAWIERVPAYGVAALPIAGRHGHTGDVPNPVHCAASSLDNGIMRVVVGKRGRVSITTGDRRFADLVFFEDVRDSGDLYTPSPREPAAVCEFMSSRLVFHGPLRGMLALNFALATVDAGEHGLPTNAHITLQVSLDAGAPFVRFRIVGHNYGSDHRLRIGFRTGMSQANVWADAAFGPVHREPLQVPAEDTARERPQPTAPLHRYVSLFANGAGATIYSDGLAEYEATDDGDLLVTLVRAVGQLSRDDIPERPGHAGWPAPTPAAQCHGPFEAELAFFPHGARTSDEVARIDRVADDVLLPLCGTTLRSAVDIAESVMGFELEGAGLSFSAVMEAEDGESTILRCVNLLDEPREGAWRLGSPVEEARLARLDETPLEKLSVESTKNGAIIRFTAAPRAVVTVLLK